MISQITEEHLPGYINKFLLNEEKTIHTANIFSASIRICGEY